MAQAAGAALQEETQQELLVTPSDPRFHFPYPTPYSIQSDLQRHLYSALAKSQVTVIESPTGTGKSLSLLCASLTFLSDLRGHTRADLIARTRAQVADSFGGSDEPEWVMEQELERVLRDLVRGEEQLEDRLAEVREREAEERARGRRNKRARLGAGDKGKGKVNADANDEFAPDPYDEDEHKIADNNEIDNYSPAVRELMKKFAGGGKATKADEDDEMDTRKILFASRTHSQLSQLISELRKTDFARATDPTLPHLNAPTASCSNRPSTPSHPTRLIPLGSRQQLCINDDVRSKSGGSNDALTDLCLELQKKGPEGRCKCLPPPGETGKLEEFRDRALASVHDIEDIEDLGRRMGTCPYYGTRKAVRQAEFVTLPYNLLMNKTAREALNINLQENIVIIDEAHNLIDLILSLHTVSITLSQLTSIRSGLITYYTKFKNRFTGANGTYLRQLVLVVKGLAEFAEKWASAGESARQKGGRLKGREEMLGANEVLAGVKGGAVDQINLFKLEEYLKKSQIARKIGGYVDSLAEQATAKGRAAVRSDATRQLHRIQSFFLSLTHPSTDGRVLFSSSYTSLPSTNGQPAQQKLEVTLKYLLLAPSESFRDIAEQARSVVLAGGTMAPMSDFSEQLFPYLPAERFSTFSCGHVVPQEHVKLFAVARGPTGTKFEFTFDARGDEKLQDELGQALINICQVTHKGVVIFVPSYDFLDRVQTRWTTTGAITRLGQRKKVFWEPKSSAEVEPTLREYALANEREEKGGVLFAVVGAKLSEGINFADDMARTVVICGIPYPNAQSTELKERMRYLDTTQPPGKSTIKPSQVLYQNLAFRAVNQSIGRALRHQRDWAAIVLLDARYTQPAKQRQLPGWLAKNVTNVDKFGELVGGLAGFMKTRRVAGAASA